MMSDPRLITLQMRLADRFGDNGMIAVIIARGAEDLTAVIDTWLMSCRVLGRNINTSTLFLLFYCGESGALRRFEPNIYRPKRMK